jgi:quercetin dioxygenase-like cupin family protein
MKVSHIWISATAVISFVSAFTGSAQAFTGPAHDKASVRSRVVFAHALPKLSGEQLKASIVEVTYGPGGSSSPHSHPCPVIGYVIEGTLRMQINDDPEVVYKAGDSFYEAPNSAHVVSANASDKESAKFLAYFICDHPVPLSIPTVKTPNAGGK